MMIRIKQVSTLVVIAVFSALSVYGQQKYSRKQLQIHQNDSIYIAGLAHDSDCGDKGKFILLNTSGEKVSTVYDKISRYQNNLLALQANQKIGLCNIKGKIVLDVEYQGIDYLINDFYKIKKNDKWGVYNIKTGQVTNPPIYTSIKYIESEVTPFVTNMQKVADVKQTKNKMALVETTKDGNKCVALLNLITSEEFIPCGKYDNIEYSDRCEFMRVIKGHEWEMLDYKGKKHLSSKEYQHAKITPYGFITSDGYKEGFIPLDGSVIKPKYSEIKFADNGVAIVKNNFAESEKYGVIKSDGTEIITVQYHYIYINDKYISIVKNGKYGIADLNGKILLTAKYDDINYSPKNGLAVISNGDKKGLISINGKTLLPAKYENVYYENGVARISDANNKWGLYNVEKNLLIKPKYDGMEKFENGVAVISKHNSTESMYGLINSTGKELIKLTYNTMFFNEAQKYASVSLGRKYGMIDAKGEVVVPVIFDKLESYKPEENPDGIVVVKKGDKYGAYNFFDKKELLAANYDNVYYLSAAEGLRYSENGKLGIVDNQGKTILPAQYSFIGKIYPGKYFNVGIAGKYGVVNMKNEIVVPIEYSNLFGVNVNRDTVYIRAQKGGKAGIIDFLNNVIIDFDYEKINFDWKLNYFYGKKGGKAGLIDIATKQFITDSHLQGDIEKAFSGK